MAFLSNGHAIKYVPLDYLPRAGRSKFHWLQETFAYVLQVVRMVMTYEPLRVFLPLGGALFVVALFKVGWDAITKHFYVTSNAIVLVRDRRLIGIGSGQTSRVDAARHAVEKAHAILGADSTAGAACASDAFYPFPDAVEVCLAAGVGAFVQPGGSIRDADVIATADAAGATMLVTGVRHFRH